MSGREPPPGAVTIERLGFDGDGVVTLDGAPTYVRGTLPGDVVLLRPPRKERGIPRADLERIAIRARHRIDSICPVALHCGGCPLIFGSHHLETSEKKALVERAFRTADLDVPVELVAPEPFTGYRMRARLAFRAAPSGGTLGYHAAHGRELVDVEHCVVLDPRLDAALGAVRASLLPLLSGAGELHLGLGAERAVVSIVCEAAQSAEVFRALEALVTGPVEGASIVTGGATARTTFGTATEEARDVDDRALEVPLGGFRQAHAAASAELARTVLSWSGLSELPQRVLELFAGHGNFTLPLAARAVSVTAVESNREATAALARNLARHGLTATVRTSDAALALTKEKRGAFDVVVLDPPRIGAKDCALGIVALRPKTIVYVSCDPRTLARDCALFVKAGFALERVKAVNAFPRTAAIEAVAVLRRA